LNHETHEVSASFELFKENDQVRVNDDAVLAPEMIRGQEGRIVKVAPHVARGGASSDELIAKSRYPLVRHPHETEILGLVLEVYFPNIESTMLVASNEVTLLSRFHERIMELENRLISHLTNPQQFTVLGDGGLDVPFINQNFDAPFFGDLVKFVLRPKLGRKATKVMSPEASGPPLAAVYASMAGLSFVRAVKVQDQKWPEVPATWRGAIVGDVKVPSATRKTEFYFAVPQGSISPNDRVIIFDDVGFTGRTRNACVQLIERQGAKVEAVVNVIEKSYGERRSVSVQSRAVLGISGYEPQGPDTCNIEVDELMLERLETPRIISGVRYEASRSLLTVQR